MREGTGDGASYRDVFLAYLLTSAHKTSERAWP